MGKFSSLETATRTRSVIERICVDIVNRSRPEARYGRVVDFDVATGEADVLLLGETEPMRVYFSPANTPRFKDFFVTGELQSEGDSVKVSGRVGSYYITEILSTGPASPWNTRYTGELLTYAKETPPDEGWLPCRGGTYSGLEYPALYDFMPLAYQTGTPDAPFFTTPNLDDSALVGVGFLGILEAVGGTWNHDHTHTIAGSTHDHQAGNLVGTDEANTMGGGTLNRIHNPITGATATASHEHGGATGSTSGAAHPRIGVYFYIKT